MLQRRVGIITNHRDGSSIFIHTIDEIVVPLKLYTHYDELVEIHVHVQNGRATAIKDKKGLDVDPERFRVVGIKAMALQRLKDNPAHYRKEIS